MATPSGVDVYHITHIDNLRSVIADGRLHTWAGLLRTGGGFTDIAHGDIQVRRGGTLVPCGPGGTLHDYVPFYFAPRSPMLYTTSRGNVRGYDGGQEPIAHLVVSVSDVHAAGHRYVFTDGHAIMALSGFFTDLSDLDKVDWEVMRARYWSDTGADMDRRRRRQAEFLIFGHVPWNLVREIGVMNREMKAQVEAILSDAAHRPDVVVHREWYY